MEQQVQKTKPSLRDKKIMLWLTANAIAFYLMNDICSELHVKSETYILTMGSLMWLSMGPMFLFMTLTLRKATNLNRAVKLFSLAAGWLLVLSLFIGPVLAYLAVKNHI